jgi:hypothetical protein
MLAIDTFVYVLLGALSILITVLGSRSAENDRFRTLFHILGVLSFGCVLIAGVRNYQTQNEATESQKKLDTNIEDITRVQNLNTELQNQLIKSNAAVVDLSKENLALSKENVDLSKQNVELSKQNVALAKQSVEELTGGDSICYVGMFALGNSDVIHVGLLGKGKNPVSSVTIKITDLDVFQQLFKPGEQTGNLSLENIQKADTNYSFPTPTRYSGFFKPIYTFTPSADQISRSFNVFVLARMEA